MLIATLTDKGRLFRKLNVVTSEGVFEVIYDGNGIGYESILVDGKIAARTSSYFWYVPEFNFNLGSLSATVNVRVSLLLSIRLFSLEVEGQQLYAED
ncbi:MAG TPA: hypothetical protein VEX64_02445 [Pyrinomonadaceae bacterium]|jgi:hypothetical protein|nr:hypothetical protein [Pyrinomonadaceae bacterium]